MQVFTILALSTIARGLGTENVPTYVNNSDFFDKKKAIITGYLWGRTFDVGEGGVFHILTLLVKQNNQRLFLYRTSLVDSISVTI